jgi:1-deoxy-D-xylulose-5-phosphate reductoisomerase
MKRLSILGATGSIGQTTLRIVDKFPERFTVEALAAKQNVELLARQIAQYKPKVAAVYDAQLAGQLRGRLPDGVQTEILFGPDGYRTVATLDSVHTVVSAFVGAAGLLPTLAAVNAGKQVALANKETLVMAGDLVMSTARSKGIRILPVDSEHSAIFQCLAGNRRRDFQRILLTASGGPFRDRPVEDLATVTPAEALKHPNWQMGNKITIDSATLMNKGLEVIEARWLFDVDPQDIEVLVHPQSIVHSMVAYRDGTVMAQLGIPDMEGAIAYALSYPERLPLGQPLPDFFKIGALRFHPPDMEKFPCLALAFEALRAGGTHPAVVNAANEIAVAAFLEGRLAFNGISRIIAETASRHDSVDRPQLEDILQADAWARQVAAELVQKRS